MPFDNSVLAKHLKSTKEWKYNIKIPVLVNVQLIYMTVYHLLLVNLYNNKKMLFE